MKKKRLDLLGTRNKTKLKPTVGLKCKLKLSFKMRISQADDNCHATNLEAHSVLTNAWYTDHKNNESSCFFINFSETAIKEIKPSYKYCETKKVFDYMCNQNEADLEPWVEILCTKSSLALYHSGNQRHTDHRMLHPSSWHPEAEPHLDMHSALVKLLLHLLLERKVELCV